MNRKYAFGSAALFDLSFVTLPGEERNDLWRRASCRHSAVSAGEVALARGVGALCIGDEVATSAVAATNAILGAMVAA